MNSREIEIDEAGLRALINFHHEQAQWHIKRIKILMGKLPKTKKARTKK